MPIVQSGGALQAMTVAKPRWGGLPASLPLSGSYNADYATIYATQPNVRTCVDFLARNIAMLDWHVFRRVSDTDRVRLPDHELERWLDQPVGASCRYRLFENLMGDLGIYYNAYWLKVPNPTTGLGLLRLPPEEVEVEGGLFPSQFTWRRNGQTQPFTPGQVVMYDGYNPTNSLVGLSPLETLRRILAEDVAAGEHREAYWQNASRMEGVIEWAYHPNPNVKDWTEDKKKEWRRQWQERFAGAAGAGHVAVLERGQTYKPVSFSPKDSEYLAARKLSREECASAYHIPLPLVGILDHATFSNMKEQHKHLYQDTLGPWLRLIKEVIQRQLLVEADDRDRVYIEANIRAKMEGSFEEQAASLHMAVGRPYMTPNEARARLNLPRITNDPTADQLAPQQGGPATPAIATREGATESETEARVRTVIAATHARVEQRLQRLPRGDRAAAFFADIDRWNEELTADLLPHVGRLEEAQRRALAANAALLSALDTAVEAA